MEGGGVTVLLNTTASSRMPDFPLVHSEGSALYFKLKSLDQY